MKKIINIYFIFVCCAFFICACSKDSDRTEAENTEFSFIEYTENEDGTFSTDNYTYKYKIILTGRLNNAERDSWYEVLTNKEDVTFDEVARSLYSSQIPYWPDGEETVIINLGVFE